MITKKELLNYLKDVPDDAIIRIGDGDGYSKEDFYITGVIIPGSDNITEVILSTSEENGKSEFYEDDFSEEELQSMFREINYSKEILIHEKEISDN